MNHHGVCAGSGRSQRVFMKFAAVIDVGHSAPALKHAVDAQMLLLDRLGTRLHSIRLAPPRLLNNAYAAALAEKPDVLVVVGCARAARRAGQLAYEQKAPVIFLPGPNAPEWGHTLWDALTLDETVGALARDEIKRVHLNIGMAASQIFFQDVQCGLLPFVPELRRDLSASQTFVEGWHAVRRAAKVSGSLIRRTFAYAPQGDGVKRATALVLAASDRNVQTGSLPDAHFPLFRGTAYRLGPLSYIAGLVRGCSGGKWQGGSF